MPAGEIIGEALGFLLRLAFEIFLEIFLELVCHGTGRILVYVFTFGRVKVKSISAPASEEKARKKLKCLSSKTGRDRYIHFDLVSLIGLLFWVAVIAGIVWYRMG